MFGVRASARSFSFGVRASAREFKNSYGLKPALRTATRERRYSMFGKPNSRPRPPLVMPALLCLALRCAAAPAGEAPPTDTGSLSSVMGALGEGSQLIGADDGEFVVDLDGEKNLTTFRAIRDVIVLTQDMALRCHELVYDRQNEVITATAAPGQLVHVNMTNVASDQGGLMGGGDTRATCRLYQFLVREREHVLQHDPVIYQKDPDGKETAVRGRIVTINQDENGRWRMHIKGDRGRSAPRSEIEVQKALKLKRARELWGILKPIINIDMNPPAAATATPTTGTRAVELDASNIDTVRREKPGSLLQIEQGGATRMGTMMPTMPAAPSR